MRALFSLILAPCILLAACGIPSAPYLPPIPAASVESPLLFETDYFFSIPDPEAINPEVFEGFEIYYKLFDTEAANEELDINGDTSLSTPVTQTSLLREGYVRLASSGEVNLPLPRYPVIVLADADMDDPDTQIELEFSNFAGNEPRSVYGNVVFRRTLKTAAATRELKSFAAGNFESGDSDLPAGFVPEENIEIAIALYGLSYGNDYENLSFNIHSTAVFLGNSFLNL